jgi:hypothetical protein
MVNSPPALGSFSASIMIELRLIETMVVVAIASAVNG